MLFSDAFINGVCVLEIVSLFQREGLFDVTLLVFVLLAQIRRVRDERLQVTHHAVGSLRLAALVVVAGEEVAAVPGE